jgi:hypothetical protein
MAMEQALVKQSSSLTRTERQSSTVLVLARLLDDVSMIYKVETSAGAIRIWGQCFQDETPQMLEETFLQHFQFGKFPPRPADIQAIITEKRQTAEYKNYIPSSQEDREALAVWHSSSEYKQFIDEWVKKIEASPMKRGEPTTVEHRDPLPIENWTPQQLEQRKQELKEQLRQRISA